MENFPHLKPQADHWAEHRFVLGDKTSANNLWKTRLRTVLLILVTTSATLKVYKKTTSPLQWLTGSATLEGGVKVKNEPDEPPEGPQVPGMSKCASVNAWLFWTVKEWKEVRPFNWRVFRRSHMDNLIEDGKNSKWVVCKFCQSKVLRPSTARYEEREVSLWIAVELQLHSWIKLHHSSSRNKLQAFLSSTFITELIWDAPIWFISYTSFAKEIMFYTRRCQSIEIDIGNQSIHSISIDINRRYQLYWILSFLIFFLMIYYLLGFNPSSVRMLMIHNFFYIFIPLFFFFICSYSCPSYRRKRILPQNT